MKNSNDSTNYRSVLTAELASRCLRNPRYSQAAFARDLGLSPSLISEVLNGRHDLSHKKAEIVARGLGLDSRSTRLFCDSVDAQSSRSPKKRKDATQRLEKTSTSQLPTVLRDEQLRAMESWFHIGILEVLRLSDAGKTESEIVNSLKLQAVVVREAMRRLETLGLVRRQGAKWIVCNQRLIVEGGVPSETLRRLHEQFLVKAQQAIYGQKIDQRYLTTAVLPVPRKRVKDVFLKLDQIRKDLSDEIHTYSDKDTVYCLTLQFFELTEE